MGPADFIPTPPLGWAERNYSDSPLSPQLPDTSLYGFNIGDMLGQGWDQGSSGPLTMLMSLFFQQSMQGQGRTFMPPGIDPYRVLTSRSRGTALSSVMQQGITMDSARMAQYASQIFGVSPSAAYQMSSMILPWAPGLASNLPGGSAMEMGAGFFAATQMMRDQSFGGFARIPAKETRGMFEDLMRYYAPGGVVDPRKTMGLQLGQLGSLSAALASEGLLQAGVTADDEKRVGDKLGVTFGSLNEGQLASARTALRGQKIAEQMKDYAEITASLADIMGKPNAPLVEILANLKALTGGSLASMRPSEVQQMLSTLRSTAEVTGVAAPIVLAASQQAAAANKAMGLPESLGVGQVSNALLAAQAAQNSVTGPFFGRMSREELVAGYMGAAQRAQTSRASIYSTNVAVSLDALGEEEKSRLTGDQATRFTDMRNKALRGEYTTPSELQEVTQFMNEIGRPALGSMSRLTSGPRAIQGMAQHPGIGGAVMRNIQPEEARGMIQAQLTLMRPKGITAQEVGGVTAAMMETGSANAERILTRYRENYGTPSDALRGFVQDVVTSQGMLEMAQGAQSKSLAGFLQQWGTPSQLAWERGEQEKTKREEGHALMRRAGIRDSNDFVQRFLAASYTNKELGVDAVLTAMGFSKTDQFASMRGDLGDIQTKWRTWQDDQTNVSKRDQFRSAVGNLRDRFGVDTLGASSMEGVLTFQQDTKDLTQHIEALRGVVTDTGTGTNDVARADALLAGLRAVKPETWTAMEDWSKDVGGEAGQTAGDHTQFARERMLEAEALKQQLEDAKTRGAPQDELNSLQNEYVRAVQGAGLSTEKIRETTGSTLRGSLKPVGASKPPTRVRTDEETATLQGLLAADADATIVYAGLDKLGRYSPPEGTPEEQKKRFLSDMRSGFFGTMKPVTDAQVTEMQAILDARNAAKEPEEKKALQAKLEGFFAASERGEGLMKRLRSGVTYGDMQTSIQMGPEADSVQDLYGGVGKGLAAAMVKIDEEARAKKEEEKQEIQISMNVGGSIQIEDPNRKTVATAAFNVANQVLADKCTLDAEVRNA